MKTDVYVEIIEILSNIINGLISQVFNISALFNELKFSI